MSLDDLDVGELRLRQSEKWGRYGGDVLGLGIAEMDVPLAGPVREVLVRTIERGDCGYVDSENPALAEAFAGFAADEWGWAVDPAGVLPATDVMLGIQQVLLRVTDPGDVVVINPPVYPPYFRTIAGIGRRVAEVQLVEGRLDLAGIEEAFAGGARAMLLCNPHNPTGRVVPAAELRELAAIAARHGATVIADEIHAPLVLGDAAHQPFLALGGEAAEVGITVTSTSKGWNLAALKCAVIVAAAAKRGGASGARAKRARSCRLSRLARLLRRLERRSRMARRGAGHPAAQPRPAGRTPRRSSCPRRAGRRAMPATWPGSTSASSAWATTRRRRCSSEPPSRSPTGRRSGLPAAATPGSTSPRQKRSCAKPSQDSHVNRRGQTPLCIGAGSG